MGLDTDPVTLDAALADELRAALTGAIAAGETGWRASLDRLNATPVGTELHLYDDLVDAMEHFSVGGF